MLVIICIIHNGLLFTMQFAAGACGSDVPIISQKQQILAPSGVSYIDRYKSQSVGSDLDTTPPPEMLVCM